MQEEGQGKCHNEWNGVGLESCQHRLDGKMEYSMCGDSRKKTQNDTLIYDINILGG